MEKKTTHTHTHTQNDAPFVAFYDMPTVTFVLPDEMADVSIAGLQCLSKYRKPAEKRPRTTVWFSQSIVVLLQMLLNIKNKIWDQERS